MSSGQSVLMSLFVQVRVSRINSQLGLSTAGMELALNMSSDPNTGIKTDAELLT